MLPLSNCDQDRWKENNTVIKIWWNVVRIPRNRSKHAGSDSTLHVWFLGFWPGIPIIVFGESRTSSRFNPAGRFDDSKNKRRQLPSRRKNGSLDFLASPYAESAGSLIFFLVAAVYVPGRRLPPASCTFVRTPRSCLFNFCCSSRFHSSGRGWATSDELRSVNFQAKSIANNITQLQCRISRLWLTSLVSYEIFDLTSSLDTWRFHAAVST